MNNEKLRQFIADLNQEPNKDDVRQNEDKSFYLPISVVQNLLDDVFLGQWSFEINETTFGRKWARGSGIMEIIHPITGNKIRRSGDAGIFLTGNFRTDSPRLEAMILLSCAKKFGKVFGRDLNRSKDDAPLPIIKVDKPDASSEEKRMKLLIEDCNDAKELESYRLVIPKSLKRQYESKLKQLNQQP
jgi:hypothetical protein